MNLLLNSQNGEQVHNVSRVKKFRTASRTLLCMPTRDYMFEINTMNQREKLFKILEKKSEANKHMHMGRTFLTLQQCEKI